MASVKAFIRVSSSKKKIEKEVAVRFRVSDGRKIQLFYKSDILVDPVVWDAKRECIKAKVLFKTIERVLFDESIRRMKTTLETVYQEAEDKDTLTSESFEQLVDMKLHPENYKAEKETRDRDFFNQFEYFLQVKNYPESDNKNYVTMIRMLKRFQLYKTITNGAEWKLDFDTINVETIREIEDFIRNNMGKPMTLIYLDLDRFKDVNDNYGHKRGDHVLQETSKFILGAFPDGIVSRLGGDEFTVIMEKLIPEQEVQRRCEELDKKVCSLFRKDGLCLSVSYGISVTNGNRNIDGLLREADNRMYEHKRNRHEKE